MVSSKRKYSQRWRRYWRVKTRAGRPLDSVNHVVGAWRASNPGGSQLHLGRASTLRAGLLGMPWAELEPLSKPLASPRESSSCSITLLSYDSGGVSVWCVNTCGLVRLNRVRVATLCICVPYPVPGNAITSWNQSESPKESRVCSIDDAKFLRQNQEWPKKVVFRRACRTHTLALSMLS